MDGIGALDGLFDDGFAIRQFNITNDRMTFRHKETIYDFKNAKALEAAALKTERIGVFPLAPLIALCMTPGDGFGSQHTGPRGG